MGRETAESKLPAVPRPEGWVFEGGSVEARDNQNFELAVRVLAAADRDFGRKYGL